MQYVINLLILVLLTIGSGIVDGWGFAHAAQIWQNKKLVPGELTKSAIGFGSGIVLFWVSLRFMQGYGIVSAELQAIIWFGVVMIIVACFSGKFATWNTVDQFVALGVISGIGWLIVRNK